MNKIKDYEEVGRIVVVSLELTRVSKKLKDGFDNWEDMVKACRKIDKVIVSYCKKHHAKEVK